MRGREGEEGWSERERGGRRDGVRGREGEEGWSERERGGGGME